MHRLLKAAKTEAVNNFLKLTTNVTIYGYWLISDDACYLDWLGSVGAGDLIPCKTPYRDL